MRKISWRRLLRPIMYEFLHSGDRFNLATRKYVPGPGKEPVDSDLQRAVGVEFEGPDSGKYVTNREDAYSICRIRMDVRPVRVHQPFYTVE